WVTGDGSERFRQKYARGANSYVRHRAQIRATSGADHGRLCHFCYGSVVAMSISLDADFSPLHVAYSEAKRSALLFSRLRALRRSDFAPYRERRMSLA